MSNLVLSDVNGGKRLHERPGSRAQPGHERFSVTQCNFKHPWAVGAAFWCPSSRRDRRERDERRVMGTARLACGIGGATTLPHCLVTLGPAATQASRSANSAVGVGPLQCRYNIAKYQVSGGCHFDAAKEARHPRPQ